MIYRMKRWIKQLLCILGIEIVRCNRCHSVVEPSELPDYTYQCFECDEDLYTFETYTEGRK